MKINIKSLVISVCRRKIEQFWNILDLELFELKYIASIVSFVKHGISDVSC